MIRTLALAAAASLALSAGAAMAQTVTRADVGSFVRDQNGAVIGSLKSIQGNQAVVWIGFVNTPGNHLETVPLTQLAANDGRLVLSGDNQLATR